MMGLRRATSASTGNRRDRQGNTMAYSEQWGERLAFYLMDVEQQHEAFVRDVAQGLAAPQKTLPAKYFYDARGSQLYELICTLPEYYPYRAERDILTTYAPEIYADIGHVPLVEFGSGNATKTRYLLTAYDDAQGVTAAFNLNLLHRMNRDLGANFHVPAFAHLAHYNEEHGRIEMHLRSRWAQHVTIAKTAQTISFAADETIHTENSYK